MGDAIFLFAFKGINFNNVAIFEKGIDAVRLERIERYANKGNFMNIQQVIKENRLELLFQQGSFGLEKEI